MADWVPVEADLDTIAERYDQPLFELVEGRVPAFIFRSAYSADHAASLVDRFYRRGLLFDPRLREGVGRVDVGTSMGSHGRDPDRFFQHADQTNALFATLFDGCDNPVERIYRTVAGLAPGKQVKTAREADGRLYGPAIFRTYYEERGHGPHTDTLWRDRVENTPRSRYAIGRFEHQLSVVLCLQDSAQHPESGQTFLYRQRWTPAMQTGWNKTFHRDAQEQGIARVRVQLQPGDLYVFCSEYVHEVPHVQGDKPRIVLAAFFAMSEEDGEIYGWS
ncbi:MAG: hypothetical protein GKR89_34965 [Candidatus Latescibacteria bacterium]|nr:hypothetical protein [Candidatus Latescibacterota bacterium]